MRLSENIYVANYHLSRTKSKDQHMASGKDRNFFKTMRSETYKDRADLTPKRKGPEDWEWVLIALFFVCVGSIIYLHFNP